MDKQWERENVSKYEEAVQEYENKILSFVKSCNLYRKHPDKIKTIEELSGSIKAGIPGTDTDLFESFFNLHNAILLLFEDKNGRIPENDAEVFYFIKENTETSSFNELQELLELPVYPFIQESKIAAINRDFVDKVPIAFNGDIVIAGSQCINKKNGIGYFTTANTLCGGSCFCSIFSSNDIKDEDLYKEDFVPDANDIIGIVKVFSLISVLPLSYEGVKEWAEIHPDKACIIKNFCGTVQFIVREDSLGRFNLFIVGKGINSKTGVPLNFSTKIQQEDNDIFF